MLIIKNRYAYSTDFDNKIIIVVHEGKKENLDQTWFFISLLFPHVQSNTRHM